MKMKMHTFLLIILFILLLGISFFWYMSSDAQYVRHSAARLPLEKTTEKIPEIIEEKKPELDTEAYDLQSEYIANNPKPIPIILSTTTPDGATTTIEIYPDPVPTLYPVTNVPYPKYGALLPFNRIIAYYGNFYSTRMGALGEYQSDEMLLRLQVEIDAWNTIDPETPAIPAIHYIASTAQGSPGKEGLYTLRMPDDQIQHAIDLAERIDGVVFLDLQIGLSNLQTELPFIREFLKLPQVHLGIDPEFAMKTGAAPGHVIGSYNDEDINYTINYLSDIVRQYDLPPKVLVIHRFTGPMVKNTYNIKPTEEVQVVMHMDGWGAPENKFGTYNRIVAPEPVQFTGFKIFYKNDIKHFPHRLVTPAELMNAQPRPIYIQYQ